MKGLDRPNFVLQVVGQRVGVAVEDETGDAATANSAAMIADDVGVWVFRECLHSIGFLE